MTKHLIMTLIGALALGAAPALAQETYQNAAYGYSFSVPDGLYAVAQSPEDPAGRIYMSADQLASLTVYGGPVNGGSFQAHVDAAKGSAQQQGWTVTYEAGGNDWAVYSGTFGSQIIYVRMEAQCGGSQYASVYLTFGDSQRATYDPLTGELANRLETNSNC